MTDHEFNQLEYIQRLHTTRKADYVTCRDDALHFIFLYQLGSVYIEAYYHKQYNYISSLAAFSDTEKLEPYLPQIEHCLA